MPDRVQPPGSQPPGSQGSQPPGSEVPGSHPLGSQPPGSHPPGSQPPGSHPPGSQPPGSQVPGSQPPGSQVPGSYPPGTQPPGPHLLETQPTGSYPPGSQPPGSHPPGSQPPGSKTPMDTKGQPLRHNFVLKAFTEEEENAFDYVRDRANLHPTGMVGAIAHMVKGALGGGILGGHVAYSKAGVSVALIGNIFFGVYMAYCLHLLVQSAQILYKRTHISTMSYPDVGEAAMACHPNPKVAKFAKVFRYLIDTLICLDLFGACACYQLIIAKSIKQLIENTQTTSMEGLTSSHPGLRVYMAIMILPIILICLIRHLKYLAPFSLAANFVVFLALCTAVFYAFKNNPTFGGMLHCTNFYSTLEFTGMIVFSMSCAGVVIPIENNMAEPKKFPYALFIGMSIIVSGTAMTGFFGYAAFLSASEAPITMNFPMDGFAKFLKGLIGLMIYVTHALNFWPPFNICFYYISKRHDQQKIVMWELIYRGLFVVGISFIAIVFPNINALMGFLGAFCLTNMAFIWPLYIHLLVIWQRPGLGKYNWRLWRCVGLMSFAVFIFFCGSVVNMSELLSVFR